MPRKLTHRQLILSVLAFVEGVSYKEIAARMGVSRSVVAEYLSRKRTRELDDAVYEELLSAITGQAASAVSAEAFLEARKTLKGETHLPDETLTAIEQEVLTGSRLIRNLLLAALRRSEEARPEQGYPHVLEISLARRQAEEQFAALKRLNVRPRLAVVRLNREYQSWALMERCCEAAIDEGSGDLERSAAWARLALAIAKWVPGLEGWRNRVRGYAFAHWGNLLKVRGELKTAEVRLEEAKRLWLAGFDPSGLLDPGRLFDLEGVSAQRPTPVRRGPLPPGPSNPCEPVPGARLTGSERSARERFAAEKMFYDVALALLEESALLLDESRTEEVKALSVELTTVFESKGAHREALAALRVFEEAVRRETATAELARQILRFLLQARHDQGLRFES